MADNHMSSSYQFSRWYEVQQSDELKGSCLHSPRIREGPPNVTSHYATHTLMYSKKGRDWKDFRNAAEDWENTQSVNLSYQDLGDAYQRGELLRCLTRLVNCTHLHLTDNCLSDLSRVTLPVCTHINLSRNHFSSTRKLPSASRLQHLSLTDNHFTAIPSLSSKYPNLKSLHFRGNPVEFSSPQYRYQVFQRCPGLECLDDYPRLPSDAPLVHSDSTSSTSSTNSESHSKSLCTIS